MFDLSICIPVLNTRPYLEECLDSALGQQGCDLEIRILDSFSEDGSYEIATAYAKRDDRINLAQAPRGLYTSWNQVVESAKGEWIYILTSDDTIRPNCLGAALHAVDGCSDVGVVAWGLDCIDKDSKIISDAWTKFPGVSLFGPWIGKSHLRDGNCEVRRMLKVGTTVISVTGMMFRKSLFESSGGFPTNYGPRGDFLWALKAFRDTKILYLPEKLATWRIHEAQATQDDGRFAGWFFDQATDMELAFPADTSVLDAVKWRKDFADRYLASVRQKEDNFVLRASRRLANRLLHRKGGFSDKLVEAVRKDPGLSDLEAL